MDANTGIGYTFDPGIPWGEQQPQALPLFAEGGGLDPLEWSPDGRRLAGVLRSSAGQYLGLGIFSFESQSYETFEWDGYAGSTWMHNSRRLVLAVEEKLFVFDTRSKESRELLATPEGPITWVSLSPDDRTIYFSLETQEADIWLLDLK